MIHVVFFVLIYIYYIQFIFLIIRYFYASWKKTFFLTFFLYFFSLSLSLLKRQGEFKRGFHRWTNNRGYVFLFTYKKEVSLSEKRFKSYPQMKSQTYLCFLLLIRPFLHSLMSKKKKALCFDRLWAKKRKTLALRNDSFSYWQNQTVK